MSAIGVVRTGASGLAPELVRHAGTGRVTALLDLLEASDLRPGPVVDAAFSELVALAFALPPGDPALADAALLARSRRLCERGESLLEEHWAERVAEGRARVADFPYHDHYRMLVAAEQQAIADLGGTTHRRPRVVVAGSGPLPLTALLVAAAGDAEVLCLDDDPRAAALSHAVLARSGAGGVRVTRADALSWDYADADLVVVAALAGRSAADKRRLLARLAATLRPGATVAVRSVPADGRVLLYRRVERDGVPARLHVLGEHVPPPGVVNSVVVLRR